MQLWFRQTEIVSSLIHLVMLLDSVWIFGEMSQWFCFRLKSSFVLCIRKPYKFAMVWDIEWFRMKIGVHTLMIISIFGQTPRGWKPHAVATWHHTAVVPQSAKFSSNQKWPPASNKETLSVKLWAIQITLLRDSVQSGFSHGSNRT